MTNAISVEDVLHDIEVELLQGSVLSDDLGQSVQRVRRFQNQVRGDIVDNTSHPDYRAIANRQFQINDMLLTLLQESATRQKALELALQKALRKGLLPPAAGESTPRAPASADPTGLEEGEMELLPPLATDALARRLEALQAARDGDALRLRPEVTPDETPLLGRLLGGLRNALHSLVVFYGNRLAARQEPINDLYGESLQELYQLVERQQEALALLHAQVNALQAGPDEGRPQAEP